MAYPDDPGHGRRATDGLDWQPAPGPAPLPAAAAPAAPAALPPAPPARDRPGLRLLAAVALAAALLGGALSGGAVAYFARGDGSPATAPPPAAAGNLTVEQTSAVAEAASRGRASVVKIVSTRRTGSSLETDVGSGVVLDAEGRVLTNAHVVLGTESLTVVLPDGSERPAIMLGHDYPFTDIAVLQVGPGGLTPVEAGDSDALKLGETVVAIGNPLAEFDGSVTVGVVSGLARRRLFDGVLQEDLVQTDAAVNSGNSGGALVNLRGQFVAMPTAVLRQSANSAPVEGIAFAIPANRALAVARGIIAANGNYPRPSAGLAYEDIGQATANRALLAVLQGALVRAVDAGGPADAAGIAPGDIITRVGDFDVNESRPFLNALARYEPGATVKVVLNRNGRIIETEVRLAPRS